MKRNAIDFIVFDFIKYKIHLHFNDTSAAIEMHFNVFSNLSQNV